MSIFVALPLYIYLLELHCGYVYFIIRSKIHHVSLPIIDLPHLFMVGEVIDIESANHEALIINTFVMT
jgi:hypothetical protein